MARSRYHRPEIPTPIRIQKRDREVLSAVFLHRYLTGDHLHALCFLGRSKRVVQHRLRLLWENSYLDRFFAPVIISPDRGSTRMTSRPLYTLAERGAEVLSEDGLDRAEIAQTPAQNLRGWAYLEHHLVVTDFMVALEVAARKLDCVEVAGLERETTLRRRLAAWRRSGDYRGERTVISDGAVCLRFSCLRSQVWTFHIEVVRAGAPGGNQSVADKLAHYVSFHRKRLFKRIYGHEMVRAVLFATTSEARAGRLRALATKLPHCRRLFWFASYDSQPPAGAFNTTFTPSRVIEPMWRDGNGDLHSLIPSEVLGPPHHHVCPRKRTPDAEEDRFPR